MWLRASNRTIDWKLFLRYMGVSSERKDKMTNPRKIIVLSPQQKKLLEYLKHVSYRGATTETNAIKKLLDYVFENPVLLNDNRFEFNHEDKFEQYLLEHK